MKTRIAIVLSVLLVLTAFGIAGAAQIQKLLPGKSIPKFVDPLPVGVLPGDPTGISVVNATSFIVGGIPTQPLGKAPGTPYTIGAYEFQAQILPSTFVPPGLPAGTLPPVPSWVWGYLTLDDVAVPGVRASYLGPVVLAQRGVAFYPQYTNNLPEGIDALTGLLNSKVQQNLPIDMTLDWANPLPGIDCLPDALGNWTNPVCGGVPWPPYQGSMPIATHLHGGEVPPEYDGGPDAWFTPAYGDVGIGFPLVLPQGVYHYPNDQQAGTIWFHDHALGITRLNVYAGLAGLYPILDPGAEPPQAAPGAAGDPFCPGCMPKFPEYDIPLIIQDRSFDKNGEIYYNLASNPQPNPAVHPFWIPEFIGDTIVVNGKTWPFLDVESRKYRFRLVNGSNARFYDLTLNYTQNKINKKGKITGTIPAVLPFKVIATDDGYLQNPVQTNNLIIGPGERYEIIVDFADPLIPANANITMMNAARTPFPAGAAPTNNGTDTVMQFRVILAYDPTKALDVTLPGSLRNPSTNPIHDIKNGHDTFAVTNTGMITRQLTLNEVIGAGGPLELVVNNSKFNLPTNTERGATNIPIIPGCPTIACRETELPQVGDTEIWEIINITADAHPMHTHLVSFQIIDRTPLANAAAWTLAYDNALLANGVLPGQGPPNQYNIKNADGAIGGNPSAWGGAGRPLGPGPMAYEMGWKDTAIMYPGEVTRIAIRWGVTDNPPMDPADAVTGCGQAVPPAGCPGVNTYTDFDPTVTAGSGNVGYVWHCHIIDHEDNEMMRNYLVGSARQTVLP